MDTSNTTTVQPDDSAEVLARQQQAHRTAINAIFYDLGYVYIRQTGLCLFHAIGVCLNQTADSLRAAVVTHIQANRADLQNHFSGTTDEFNSYINRILNRKEQGNRHEIEIIERILNRPILVIRTNINPTIPDNHAELTDAPIFIYYNGHNNHFDMLRPKPRSNPRAIFETMRQLIQNDQQVFFPPEQYYGEHPALQHEMEDFRDKTIAAIYHSRMDAMREQPPAEPAIDAVDNPPTEVNAEAATALYAAAQAGQTDEVRALLRVQDIEVNAIVCQDDKVHTPLLVATEMQHDKVVTLLLQHPEVDWEIANQDGIKAFDYCYNDYMAQQQNESHIETEISVSERTVGMTAVFVRALRAFMLSHYQDSEFVAGNTNDKNYWYKLNLCARIRTSSTLETLIRDVLPHQHHGDANNILLAQNISFRRFCDDARVATIIQAPTAERNAALVDKLTTLSTSINRKLNRINQQIDRLNQTKNKALDARRRELDDYRNRHARVLTELPNVQAELQQPLEADKQETNQQIVYVNSDKSNVDVFLRENEPVLEKNTNILSVHERINRKNKKLPDWRSSNQRLRNKADAYRRYQRELVAKRSFFTARRDALSQVAGMINSAEAALETQMNQYGHRAVETLQHEVQQLERNDNFYTQEVLRLQNTVSRLQEYLNNIQDKIENISVQTEAITHDLQQVIELDGRPSFF